jgi:predicted Zn-dependent peptidase
MAFETANGVGGIKLYVDTMPDTQTAEIGVFVGAGSIHEPENLAGISHALEHCVHLSTDDFSDRQASRDFAGENSFRANANTYFNRTFYYGNGPEVDPMFYYFGQILFHTKFEPEPVSNEMKVITREAKTGLDEDDTLHITAADYVAFGAPYGRRVIGHHDRLDFSPEELRAYFDTYYQLGNMAVIAVGNVTLEQVTDMTGKYFTETNKGSTPFSTAVPTTTVLEHDVRSALVRGASENVRYVHSYPLRGELLEAVRSKRPVYEVAMNAISSHCFELLRNGRGISYNGGVYFAAYNNPNAWSIRAHVTTDPESTGIADGVFVEVIEAGGADYDDKKLRAAYGKYRGYLLRALDNVSDRAEVHLSSLEALKVPRDLKRTVDEIRDIDAAAIREAIDDISGYLLATPKVMHKTGRLEHVKDTDIFVDVHSIA